MSRKTVSKFIAFQPAVSLATAVYFLLLIMFILPRREREKTGFTFCLESEWAGGQKVDRTGNGLLQVWKRQIQQLNRVSPDMASAILSAYPSPRLLSQVKSVFNSEVS